MITQSLSWLRLLCRLASALSRHPQSSFCAACAFSLSFDDCDRDTSMSVDRPSRFVCAVASPALNRVAVCTWAHRGPTRRHRRRRRRRHVCRPTACPPRPRAERMVLAAQILRLGLVGHLVRADGQRIIPALHLATLAHVVGAHQRHRAGARRLIEVRLQRVVLVVLLATVTPHEEEDDQQRNAKQHRSSNSSQR
jgi:hypothetical protein